MSLKTKTKFIKVVLRQFCNLKINILFTPLPWVHVCPLLYCVHRNCPFFFFLSPVPQFISSCIVLAWTQWRHFSLSLFSALSGWGMCWWGPEMGLRCNASMAWEPFSFQFCNFSRRMRREKISFLAHAINCIMKIKINRDENMFCALKIFFPRQERKSILLSALLCLLPVLTSQRVFSSIFN